MATPSRLRLTGAFAAILLILTVPAQALVPQATSGTILEIETESDGQTAIMKLSLADDALRMDADTDEGQMSFVSTGGDEGKMIIIMHSQRQYMEITQAMMEQMAGMMGQMPQQMEAEAVDTTPPTFTRTGNTKQVGEWSAYEVLVEDPEGGDDMTMWFSEDVDADFRALGEQVIASMSSLLNSPMMRMGGGGGDTNVFDQIESQLNSTDIPDGFPVQIINDDAISTLRQIDQSATFDAAIWQAPEGYSKMSMPFGR